MLSGVAVAAFDRLPEASASEAPMAFASCASSNLFSLDSPGAEGSEPYELNSFTPKKTSEAPP